MLKLRFSKSKILEYNNCPRKYYLQNFTILGKNRPDEEPDYLVDGKYLHSYFEAYNLTPQDLWFTGRNWTFKQNRKSFDIKYLIYSIKFLFSL